MEPARRTAADVRHVGDFRVRGVLGRGGMGLVYAAVAPDGTPAAIKVMRVTDAEQAGYLRRFEREAQIRIDHPNVIRVLGSGYDEEGSPYIAFELLEGETLAQRLRRSSLQLDEALGVGVQICRGLAAIHDAGIVHRDLKPANVFLCDDGTVKLLDFGVARRDEQTTDLTQGAIVGTPSYLSPEQARARTGVDGRADLWSLGVMLYEALCGRRPFRRDSSLTTLMAVALDDPTPLDRLIANLPGEVTRIVSRLLEKNPRDRFDDARALGAALEAVDTTGAPPLEVLLDEDPGVEIAVDLGSLVFEDDATRAERTTRASATTLAPDEQRLLAVLIAVGAESSDAAREVIERAGGGVIQLMGRQLIGLFGVEEWEGDEIVRAARAALAVRAGCEAVAIASGRAFQRGQGIAGAAVDLAEHGVRARLGGVAAPRETARALGPDFATRAAGDGLVEIIGQAAGADAQPPGHVPEEVVVHGRMAELATLEGLLHEMLDDRTACAAVVVGPLGIGKTRVRQKLEERLVEQESPVRVFGGRADPRRRDQAYQVMSSVLHARARLGSLLRGWPSATAAAPEGERRAAVEALAAEAFDDPAVAARQATFLGELLGVPMPDSPALSAAREDPQLMADRLRLALLDYFVAVAERQPLALLIEDMQWADAASVRLLEELLETLAFRPIFVFATGRPELDDRYPGLFAEHGATRLALGPLSPGAAARLATDVAGRKLPRAHLEPLVRRADGNPLFVTELVRAWTERDGADDGDGSRAGSLPLPLSVEAAVQSHLDQLTPSQREVVKRAAVFERPITERDLRIVGLEDRGAVLRELARRGVFQARQRPGDADGREYDFKSTLLSDVAYASMSKQLRRELHRRLAEHLAQADDADREAIARHFEAADEHEAAGRAWAEAATAAERRGDSPEVLRCSERALELGVPDERAYALRMARAEALRFAGDREAQRRELDQARQHAVTDLERARVDTELGHCAFRLGEREAAFAAAARAVEAARAAGDATALVMALGRQATLRVFTESPAEAEALLEEAAGLARGASLHTRALLAEWQGLAANAAGDIGEQMRAFREAATLFEEVGDVRRAAGAASNVADAQNRLGAFGAAEAALRDALAKCRRVGNRVVEGYALVNLGYALTEQGRLSDAQDALEEAGALARTNQDRRLALFVDLYRARCLLHEGADGVRGVQAAARAEDVAREAERLSLNGIRVLALGLAARAMVGTGHADAALARSTEAMALRDEMGGVQEDEAALFLTHARALRAMGLDDEARAVLIRARERIEAVARKIGDLAVRVRFLTDVPAHQELMATIG